MKIEIKISDGFSVRNKKKTDTDTQRDAKSTLIIAGATVYRLSAGFLFG